MKLPRLFKKKESETADINKQLIEWVISLRKLGITDEEIRKKFEAQHYPENIIQDTFNSVESIENQKSKLVCDSVRKKEFKKILKKYKRKERKRLMLLWEQWESGKILKIEEVKKTN